VKRVAVVVPLRPDALEDARQLIEQGPPFDLDETPLEGHCIHLTDHEAVFVFEGPDVRDVVEHVIGEASVWEAATAWRACLAGKPRVADPAFAWRRSEPAPLHVPGL
jgi:hypothetical protein